VGTSRLGFPIPSAQVSQHSSWVLSMYPCLRTLKIPMEKIWRKYMVYFCYVARIASWKTSCEKLHKNSLSKKKGTIHLTIKFITQSSGRDFRDEFLKILPLKLASPYASSYQFHVHISRKKMLVMAQWIDHQNFHMT
jgi:hypothetical protein